MTLSDNTLTLEAVLEMVNSLPEAGGSGGGGSNVVTGTVTVASTSSVIKIEDALPNTSQAPKAYFLFETGVPVSDSTHTAARNFIIISIRKDGGTTDDTKGAYTAVRGYQNSGSTSISTTYVNPTAVFNNSAGLNKATFDSVVSGYLAKNIVYISPSTLLVGRTYVWGVIPWED